MPQITINFLPNKVYPSIKKQEIELMKSIKKGSTIVNQVPKVIRDLREDLGVAIYTPRLKYVGLSDIFEDNNSNLVANFISRKIHELRTEARCKDEDIFAVIYGGSAYSNTNPSYELSCHLVDAIEEGCKSEGVEPAIITGQYLDKMDLDINSYVGKNQITLWGKLVDRLNLSKDATSADIQKVLENFCEYVKIPKNCVLKILDQLPAKTEYLSTLQKF